jgi:hypothetical protein
VAVEKVVMKRLECDGCGSEVYIGETDHPAEGMSIDLTLFAAGGATGPDGPWWLCKPQCFPKAFKNWMER